MDKKMIGVCIVVFLIVVVFTCGCIEEEKIKGGIEEIKEEKIIIDGDDSDWHKLGIQPVLTSLNDLNISDEVDIKTIYLATDGEKIYALMELYGNVSAMDYIYGIALSPNRTIESEIENTWLSVRIEGGDCRFDGRYINSPLYFNSSCAVRGKNIEFICEGTTPSYILSEYGSKDIKPLTPYTLMDKSVDFNIYGVRLACYSAIDKEPIERIEKRSPKISDIIPKI
ncbi:MAG: hypothetical protein WA977_12490 [Halobacteriota archaeon]